MLHCLDVCTFYWRLPDPNFNTSVELIGAMPSCNELRTSGSFNDIFSTYMFFYEVSMNGVGACAGKGNVVESLCGISKSGDGDSSDFLSFQRGQDLLECHKSLVI